MESENSKLHSGYIDSNFYVILKGNNENKQVTLNQPIDDTGDAQISEYINTYKKALKVCTGNGFTLWLDLSYNLHFQGVLTSVANDTSINSIEVQHNVEYIACGSNHIIYIDASNNIFGIGDNSNKQIDTDNTSLFMDTFTQITHLQSREDFTNVVSIQCKGNNTYILLDSSKLLCNGDENNLIVNNLNAFNDDVYSFSSSENMVVCLHQNGDLKYNKTDVSGTVNATDISGLINCFQNTDDHIFINTVLDDTQYNYIVDITSLEHTQITFSSLRSDIAIADISINETIKDVFYDNRENKIIMHTHKPYSSLHKLSINAYDLTQSSTTIETSGSVLYFTNDPVKWFDTTEVRSIQKNNYVALAITDGTEKDPVVDDLTQNLFSYGTPHRGGFIPFSIRQFVLSKVRYPNPTAIQKLYQTEFACGILFKNREFITWGLGLGGGDIEFSENDDNIQTDTGNGYNNLKYIQNVQSIKTTNTSFAVHTYDKSLYVFGFDNVYTGQYDSNKIDNVDYYETSDKTVIYYDASNNLYLWKSEHSPDTQYNKDRYTGLELSNIRKIYPGIGSFVVYKDDKQQIQYDLSGSGEYKYIEKSSNEIKPSENNIYANDVLHVSISVTGTQDEKQITGCSILNVNYDVGKVVDETDISNVQQTIIDESNNNNNTFVEILNTRSTHIVVYRLNNNPEIFRLFVFGKLLQKYEDKRDTEIIGGNTLLRTTITNVVHYRVDNDCFVYTTKSSSSDGTNELITYIGGQQFENQNLVISNNSLLVRELTRENTLKIKEVQSTYDAVATLNVRGEINVYGHPDYGGNITSIENRLSASIRKLYATKGAFLVMNQFQQAIVWGHPEFGGTISKTDTNNSQENVVNSVKYVYNNEFSFLLQLEDNTLLSFGDARYGGDMSHLKNPTSILDHDSNILFNPKAIYSSEKGYSLLTHLNTVHTWGYYGEENHYMSREKWFPFTTASINNKMCNYLAMTVNYSLNQMFIIYEDSSYNYKLRLYKIDLDVSFDIIKPTTNQYWEIITDFSLNQEPFSTKSAELYFENDALYLKYTTNSDFSYKKINIISGSVTTNNVTESSFNNLSFNDKTDIIIEKSISTAYHHKFVKGETSDTDGKYPVYFYYAQINNTTITPIVSNTGNAIKKSLYNPKTNIEYLLVTVNNKIIVGVYDRNTHVVYNIGDPYYAQDKITYASISYDGSGNVYMAYVDQGISNRGRFIKLNVNDRTTHYDLFYNNHLTKTLYHLDTLQLQTESGQPLPLKAFDYTHILSKQYLDVSNSVDVSQNEFFTEYSYIFEYTFLDTNAKKSDVHFASAIDTSANIKYDIVNDITRVITNKYDFIIHNKDNRFGTIRNYTSVSNKYKFKSIKSNNNAYLLWAEPDILIYVPEENPTRTQIAYIDENETYMNVDMTNNSIVLLDDDGQIVVRQHINDLAPYSHFVLNLNKNINQLYLSNDNVVAKTYSFPYGGENWGIRDVNDISGILDTSLLYINGLTITNSTGSKSYIFDDLFTKDCKKSYNIGDYEIDKLVKRNIFLFFLYNKHYERFRIKKDTLVNDIIPIARDIFEEDVFDQEVIDSMFNENNKNYVHIIKPGTTVGYSDFDKTNGNDIALIYLPRPNDRVFMDFSYNRVIQFRKDYYEEKYHILDHQETFIHQDNDKHKFEWIYGEKEYILGYKVLFSSSFIVSSDIFNELIHPYNNLVVWGTSLYGGFVPKEIFDEFDANIYDFYDNKYAFGILKKGNKSDGIDNKLVTWGNPSFGAHTTSVSNENLARIVPSPYTIYDKQSNILSQSYKHGFVAIETDGTLLPWGSEMSATENLVFYSLTSDSSTNDISNINFTAQTRKDIFVLDDDHKCFSTNVYFKNKFDDINDPKHFKQIITNVGVSVDAVSFIDFNMNIYSYKISSSGDVTEVTDRTSSWNINNKVVFMRYIENDDDHYRLICLSDKTLYSDLSTNDTHIIDISHVKSDRQGNTNYNAIQKICTNKYGFIVLLINGDIRFIKNTKYDDHPNFIDISENVYSDDIHIVDIISNHSSFLCLDQSGTLYPFGLKYTGGDALQYTLNEYDLDIIDVTSSDICGNGIMFYDSGPPQIKHIYANQFSFAVVDISENIYSFGVANYGGEIKYFYNDRSENLLSPIHKVKHVYSTDKAYACLLEDGSVKTFGNVNYGGRLDPYLGTVNKYITSIYSTYNAFAAHSSYYEDTNGNFWYFKPILIAYNGEKIYIQFHKRMQKNEQVDNETINLNILLSTLDESKYNKDFVRANILYTIHKQNPDITYFDVSYSELYIDRIEQLGFYYEKDTLSIVKPNTDQPINVYDIPNNKGFFAPLIYANDQVTIQYVYGEKDYTNRHELIIEKKYNNTYLCYKEDYVTTLYQPENENEYSQFVVNDAYHKVIDKREFSISARFRYGILSHDVFEPIDPTNQIEAWGSKENGGTIFPASIYSDLRNNIRSVYATNNMFLAINEFGKMSIWGAHSIEDPKIFGGKTFNEYQEYADNISYVYSNDKAFTILYTDGTFVCIGEPEYGGSVEVEIRDDDRSITEISYRPRESRRDLSINVPVVQIVSTQSAFLCLDVRGKIHAWGDSAYGGTIPNYILDVNKTYDMVYLSSTETQFIAEYQPYASRANDKSRREIGNPSLSDNTNKLVWPSGITFDLSLTEEEKYNLFRTLLQSVFAIFPPKDLLEEKKEKAFLEFDLQIFTMYRALKTNLYFIQDLNLRVALFYVVLYQYFEGEGYPHNKQNKDDDVRLLDENPLKTKNFRYIDVLTPTLGEELASFIDTPFTRIYKHNTHLNLFDLPKDYTYICNNYFQRQYIKIYVTDFDYIRIERMSDGTFIVDNNVSRRQVPNNTIYYYKMFEIVFFNTIIVRKKKVSTLKYVNALINDVFQHNVTDIMHIEMDSSLNQYILHKNYYDDDSDGVHPTCVTKYNTVDKRIIWEKQYKLPYISNRQKFKLSLEPSHFNFVYIPDGKKHNGDDMDASMIQIDDIFDSPIGSDIYLLSKKYRVTNNIFTSYTYPFILPDSITNANFLTNVFPHDTSNAILFDQQSLPVAMKDVIFRPYVKMSTHLNEMNTLYLPETYNMEGIFYEVDYDIFYKLGKDASYSFVIPLSQDILNAEDAESSTEQRIISIKYIETGTSLQYTIVLDDANTETNFDVSFSSNFSSTDSDYVDITYGFTQIDPMNLSDTNEALVIRCYNPHFINSSSRDPYILIHSTKNSNPPFIDKTDEYDAVDVLLDIVDSDIVGTKYTLTNWAKLDVNGKVTTTDGTIYPKYKEIFLGSGVTNIYSNYYAFVAIKVKFLIGDVPYNLLLQRVNQTTPNRTVDISMVQLQNSVTKERNNLSDLLKIKFNENEPNTILSKPYEHLKRDVEGDYIRTEVVKRFFDVNPSLSSDYIKFKTTTLFYDISDALLKNVGGGLYTEYIRPVTKVIKSGNHIDESDLDEYVNMILLEKPYEFVTIGTIDNFIRIIKIPTGQYRVYNRFYQPVYNEIDMDVDDNPAIYNLLWGMKLGDENNENEPNYGVFYGTHIYFGHSIIVYKPRQTAIYDEFTRLISWGDPEKGGKISNIRYDELKNNFFFVYSNDKAYSAITDDDSDNHYVFNWGYYAYGGKYKVSWLTDTTDPEPNVSPETTIEKVDTITTTSSAFAALNRSGTVQTWGSNRGGGLFAGNYISLNNNENVYKIYASDLTFVAVNTDYKLSYWGDISFVTQHPLPSDISIINNDTNYMIKDIISNGRALTALLTDNTMRCWGDPSFGGILPSDLSNARVQQIKYTKNTFACIHTDGRVSTWGNTGTNLSTFNSQIERYLYNAQNIVANKSSYVIQKENGSLFAFGDISYGGLIPYEAILELTIDNKYIIANDCGFTVIKGTNHLVSWGDLNNVDNVNAPDFFSCKSQEDIDVFIGREIYDKVYHTNRSFAATYTKDQSNNMIIWGYLDISENEIIKQTIQEISGNPIITYDISNTDGIMRFTFQRKIANVVANNECYCVLFVDGTICQLGKNEYGGFFEPNSFQQLNQVSRIQSNPHSFVGIRYFYTDVDLPRDKQIYTSSNKSSEIYTFWQLPFSLTPYDTKNKAYSDILDVSQGTILFNAYKEYINNDQYIDINDNKKISITVKDLLEGVQKNIVHKMDYTAKIIQTIFDNNTYIDEFRCYPDTFLMQNVVLRETKHLHVHRKNNTIDLSNYRQDSNIYIPLLQSGDFIDIKLDTSFLENDTFDNMTSTQKEDFKNITLNFTRLYDGTYKTTMQKPSNGMKYELLQDGYNQHLWKNEENPVLYYHRFYFYEGVIIQFTKPTIPQYIIYNESFNRKYKKKILSKLLPY